MPESRDLRIGRSLPGTISAGDGERKNAALEMIDLLGQLATLAAVVPSLTRPLRPTRPGRNWNGECQHQYQTDDNAEMLAWTTEAKLHTGDIGPGGMEL